MQISRARSGARILGVTLAALAVAAPAALAAKPPAGAKEVNVQLLGLNDFHGQLEPPSGSAATVQGRLVGGVEYFATHVREAEKTNPNTLVVSAGDLIGATPLLSAAFHDEPTIEAMNKIGLDINAVGNHEFDEGEAELVRMANGGCHPTDTQGTCKGQTGHFDGADFSMLAANVVKRSTGQTLFEPYAIREFGGERIGFIGMTLEGTPDIVSPGGIADLRFLDEADTANRYAEELKRRHGVKAVVVLLHEGGQQNPTLDVNACNNPTGQIVDIVRRTGSEVDLFVTGHTHQAYNCLLPNLAGELRPVTSASSQGRVLTDIDLTINRSSHDVTRVAANNRLVTRKAGATDAGSPDVPKALDMTALIQHYTTLVAPIRDEVIGRITADIDKVFDDSRENEAGNLIADAQLAATSSGATGGAVAAFMNPGGVRDPGFVYAQSGSEGDGNVTYGEAFTVQPFGNNLTTITLTGQQLLDALKQQWCGQTSRTVLLPSASVSYTYDVSDADALLSNTSCGTLPNPVSDLRIGGVLVDPAQSYRITVNSFLADGGDRFSVFRTGTDRLGGAVDTDALRDYLEPTLATPIAPPALDRIDVIP